MCVSHHTCVCITPHVPLVKHKHTCVIWHTHEWYDTHRCDIAHTCVIWHTHVWYDIHMCDMTHTCVIWHTHVWYDTHMCDMTHTGVIWHTHVWYDTHMCDMTHTCVIWHTHVWYDTHMCDMTHTCVKYRTISETYAHSNTSVGMLQNHETQVLEAEKAGKLQIKTHFTHLVNTCRSRQQELTRFTLPPLFSCRLSLAR